MGWAHCRINYQLDAFSRSVNSDIHCGHPRSGSAGRTHGKGIYNNLAVPRGNQWGAGEIVLQMRGRSVIPVLHQFLS